MKLERQAHVKAKIDQRMVLQDGNHENFVSRHQRARTFACWIVNKFGIEKLKQGHILGNIIFSPKKCTTSRFFKTYKLFYSKIK